MTKIVIKEPRVTAREYDEVTYTPEQIREIWSGDTADTSLTLALLERWEIARARASQAEAERDHTEARIVAIIESALASAEPAPDDVSAEVARMHRAVRVNVRLRESAEERAKKAEAERDAAVAEVARLETEVDALNARIGGLT